MQTKLEKNKCMGRFMQITTLCVYIKNWFMSDFWMNPDEFGCCECVLQFQFCQILIVNVIVFANVDLDFFFK